MASGAVHLIGNLAPAEEDTGFYSELSLEGHAWIILSFEFLEIQVIYLE